MLGISLGSKGACADMAAINGQVTTVRLWELPVPVSAVRSRTTQGR